MPLVYRRPGVYLEESYITNPGEAASAVSVACFAGLAEKGPVKEPTRVDSWSDYVSIFGGFKPITPPSPADAPQALSYLPFSVYTYFQCGGRTAWIIRAVSTTTAGATATISVNSRASGQTSQVCFKLNALSVGTWGNGLSYNLDTQWTEGVAPDAQDVFSLQILMKNPDGVYEVVETFTGLTVTGEVPGTRQVSLAVNDPAAGSRYVRVTEANPAQPQPAEPPGSAVPLLGGTDPGLPGEGDLSDAMELGVPKLEGPLMCVICGYHKDITKINTTAGSTATEYIVATISPSTWLDRQDVTVINDSAPPRSPNTSSDIYKSNILTSMQLNPGDSYVASYCPWILIPHPQQMGSVVAIPPGGAVAGVSARVDATIGVFRAPAGVVAGITNAVGVQTKFTDTELGDFNAANVNVVRSVPGSGICIMGARTRKSFGADKYVSARRTLIYIKEVLRRTTQYAVFENNDQRLWTSLRMAADRILRPLWEAGGLKGASTAEAYFIRCDETLNTPQVIASGEVRMELGVALQYPAEFVVIRITQYDSATFSAEVVPAA